MTLLQIKTLKTTKKTSEIKSEFSCEFCNRSFQRETTMIKHLCENKRRWQDKDQPGNRIGYQAWLNFYAKNTGTKKKKTYTNKKLQTTKIHGKDFHKETIFLRGFLTLKQFNTSRPLSAQLIG